MTRRPRFDVLDAPTSAPNGPIVPQAAPPDEAIEPLLSVDDLARVLNGCRRTIERMRAAGKLPRPDLHLGKCPRWKPATVRAWIEAGGLP